MRSKILNEFTLYINAITKHEGNKDYNFEIHFENSPFSDASVKITGSTLKYILKSLHFQLESIEEIAKKYSGSVTYKQKNDFFIAIVLLSNI